MIFVFLAFGVYLLWLLEVVLSICCNFPHKMLFAYNAVLFEARRITTVQVLVFLQM